MAETVLKIKSLHMGHWQGEDGNLTYTTLALSETGNVYRYKPSLDAWIPLGMEITMKEEENKDSDYHGGF